MSRGVGDQIWPKLRRVRGKGPDAVSTLETGSEDFNGIVTVTGAGVREHEDGTVTLAGSNVEVIDGVVRITGREAK